MIDPNINPHEVTNMKEIFRFNNYCVTENGEIWSKPRKEKGCSKNGTWLKPRNRRKGGGYLCVTLYDNKKAYTRNIHRLVLETFVGSCPEGMESCHNNGIRTDNRLTNLRWDTRSKNSLDAVKHKTHRGLKNKGEHNGQAKLTEEKVRMIIYMYQTGLFTQKEIADIYGIYQSAIQKIVNKKRWRHVWTK